jgi:adenosylcobinamide-GDP ribazoletransferase
MTPDEHETPPARATGGLDVPGARGLATELRLAASFLTILPVGGAHDAAPEAVAASFAWFPLVGFLIGAALCIEDYALAPIFPQVLRSTLVILTLTVISGAVHLDGLADSADALGAGRDRERALTILRDSRVGSFGAIAIVFALMLKVLALASMGRPRRYAALYLAPGLARWTMVAVASGLDYLRERGGGAALLAQSSRRNLTLATITAVAALLPVISLRAFAAASIAVGLTLAMRWFYRRWLGGVTGDLVGAAGELAEIAVLIAMSL